MTELAALAAAAHKVPQFVFLREVVEQCASLVRLKHDLRLFPHWWAFFYEGGEAFLGGFGGAGGGAHGCADGELGCQLFADCFVE